MQERVVQMMSWAKLCRRGLRADLVAAVSWVAGAAEEEMVVEGTAGMFVEAVFADSAVGIEAADLDIVVRNGVEVAGAGTVAVVGPEVARLRGASISTPTQYIHLQVRLVKRDSFRSWLVAGNEVVVRGLAVRVAQEVCHFDSSVLVKASPEFDVAKVRCNRRWTAKT